jgi:GNAT superfamily N-acetyltransferase
LQDFDATPPEDMPYSALPMWLIRDRASGHMLGEVSVATDLLAVGVTHLGFFIVDAARQGSGFASEVYSSYEAWAIENGARWLRLGVVEGNRRGHRFWLRNGYVEIRRRQDYVIGDLSHTLIVMVKPVARYVRQIVIERVRRDRPES